MPHGASSADPTLRVAPRRRNDPGVPRLAAAGFQAETNGPGGAPPGPCHGADPQALTGPSLGGVEGGGEEACCSRFRRARRLASLKARFFSRFS